MESGQTLETAAAERELNDIFDQEKDFDEKDDIDDQSSVYDSDGEKIKRKKKKQDSETDDDEGYAYFRKNNVEEDTAIAETVI